MYLKLRPVVVSEFHHSPTKSTEKEEVDKNSHRDQPPFPRKTPYQCPKYKHAYPIIPDPKKVKLPDQQHYRLKTILHFTGMFQGTGKRKSENQCQQQKGEIQLEQNQG